MESLSFTESGATRAARARENQKRAAQVSARPEPFLKYPLDAALALVMLVFGSPILLLICFLIKREDGGPILYKQARWGRSGKTFRVYKFRTMVPDSDARYG